jgi:hypothetical protein
METVDFSKSFFYPEDGGSRFLEIIPYSEEGSCRFLQITLFFLKMDAAGFLK